MQYPRDIRGQNLFALDVNLQRILTRIGPGGDWAQRHFAALAGYEAVETSAVGLLA